MRVPEKYSSTSSREEVTWLRQGSRWRWRTSLRELEGPSGSVSPQVSNEADKSPRQEKVGGGFGTGRKVRGSNIPQSP